MGEGKVKLREKEREKGGRRKIKEELEGKVNKKRDEKRK